MGGQDSDSFEHATAVGATMRALGFLVSIEPDPASIEDRAEYRARMKPHAEAIADAIETLRQYGLSMQPVSLAVMRASYFRLVDDPRWAGDETARGVVMAALGEAWNGIGPWRG
jgi:hypothetical protein